MNLGDLVQVSLAPSEIMFHRNIRVYDEKYNRLVDLKTSTIIGIYIESNYVMTRTHKIFVNNMFIIVFDNDVLVTIL